MGSDFATLRSTHQALLSKAEAVEQQKKDPEELTKLIQEIETFLANIRDAGNNILDPRQRDLLRSFMHYWSTFVYERTGTYPSMRLAGKARKGLLSGWLAWAVVVVIGVLMLSFGAVASQLIRSYLSERQQLKVNILQPRNGDSVPYEMQIRGDYRGGLGERNLWVIVYPHGSSYYPQRPAEIRGDNTWFATARFGEATPEESDKVFDISVYLASNQANQKLREYINEADETGNWPGMPSLTDGLTLLDRVTVTRPGR